MKDMTIYEYVSKAREELESFKRRWVQNNLIDSKNWPERLPEGEWGQQELAERFGDG